MQAALSSLEGSGFAQRGASGAFCDVNSASCNNFVWLRTGGAADAEDPHLAASCFLDGPGRTVVSRLRRFVCGAHPPIFSLAAHHHTSQHVRHALSRSVEKRWTLAVRA